MAYGLVEYPDNVGPEKGRGVDMCPHYKEGACELKEEGQVRDEMRIYYCANTMHPEAYKNCPTFKERGRS